jgi:tRNA threonylcarbamoyl adenosine modification protein YjeE
MQNSTSARAIWDIELSDENATGLFAKDLALALGRGDLVTLSGDLGAGKTTLARAIIRSLADDDRLEVPSPTFTLVQIYELPRFSVVHADLYRVTTLAELSELGWEEAAESAAVLLEWPDRAGALIQADRLDIAFSLVPDRGPTHRHVRLTGYGAWAGRLSQMRAVRALLDISGFGSARRTHLEGDASTRSYERLHFDEGSAVLMKMPPRSDEPTVRQGLTYSSIAHLAQDVCPFVALARGLRERGFSAPEIYAADLEEGALIIEDLGSKRLVVGDPPAPVEERYAAAVDLLVALHGLELPETLPVAPRIQHRIPAYDLDAYLIEVELLFDWYFPHRGVRAPAAGEREAFLTLWRLTLAKTLDEPKTWVLRDFHSPNLLWLPERIGIERVGLLDFQDAVLGPPAFDVASLLMDARADISESLELDLLARYAVGRSRQDPHFDPDAFATRYMMLGAQRATKILGIFARLDRRDRKPQYIRHMPRVWKYLTRALAHPSLGLLRAWYLAHVPPPALLAPAAASAPASTSTAEP